MNRKDIAGMLNLVVPPYQPGLMSRETGYNHKFTTTAWNNSNIKNLASFFQFTTLDTTTDVNLYPDACMKIVFECDKDDPTVNVLGINTETSKLQLKPETTYFVFIPYTHLSMKLNLLPQELLNSQFNLKDVVSPKQNSAYSQWEHIATADSFENRIGIACEEINRMFLNNAYYPNLVEFSSLAICLSRSTFMMSGLSDFTGFSERYCREEFRKYFGFSPKLYNRILRFQGATKSLLTPNHEKVLQILEDCGYYDQSHFIKEIKFFTGEHVKDFSAHYQI